MRDILSRLSESLAQRYANITDDNEMFMEAINPATDKKKRIEDIKAQIAALQEEIKQIEASNDNDETLEEIEKKMKRSAAAKKAAETRKKNKEYWDRRNREVSSWTNYEASYSCGGSGWGYGRSSC